MGVLRPPFNFADVRLFTAPDYLLQFPDRYLGNPTPATPARYENSKILLMRIVPATGHTTFGVQWPADSCPKSVDITSGDSTALGIPKLLELSMLPFALDAVLRAHAGRRADLLPGLFKSPYPVDDSALLTTDAAVQATSAVFGMMFQDRATLAPWAWFDRIAAALRPTQPQDAALWDNFSAAFAGRRSLRVLDAQGHPYPGQTITMTITDGTREYTNVNAGFGRDRRLSRPSSSRCRTNGNSELADFAAARGDAPGDGTGGRTDQWCGADAEQLSDRLRIYGRSPAITATLAVVRSEPAQRSAVHFNRSAFPAQQPDGADRRRNPGVQPAC